MSDGLANDHCVSFEKAGKFCELVEWFEVGENVLLYFFQSLHQFC